MVLNKKTKRRPWRRRKGAGKKATRRYNPFKEKGQPKAVVLKGINSPVPKMLEATMCTSVFCELPAGTFVVGQQWQYNGQITAYPYQPFSQGTRPLSGIATTNGSFTVNSAGFYNWIYNAGQGTGLYQYFTPLSGRLYLDIVCNNIVDEGVVALGLLRSDETTFPNSNVGFDQILQSPFSKSVLCQANSHQKLSISFDTAKMFGTTRNEVLQDIGAYGAQYNTLPVRNVKFVYAMQLPTAATNVQPIYLRFKMYLYGRFTEPSSSLLMD